MAQANTGTCELCGKQAPKPRMARHIAHCAPAHDASGPPTLLVLLRVEAAEDPRYWLDIETKSATTLQQLDALLRRVWVECCGHMSAFRIGQREVAMRSQMGAVLERRGQKFTYDYDFGSTTTLRGQVVGGRQGSLGRRALRLLARNDPLQWTCHACTQPATIVCPFCVDSGPSLFCVRHAQEHQCAEEGAYLPVVNSPRMGVCAYARVNRCTRETQPQPPGCGA